MQSVLPVLIVTCSRTGALPVLFNPKLSSVTKLRDHDVHIALGAYKRIYMRVMQALSAHRTPHAGKRVQANLGAKNHAVIMPDADVESTVKALAGAGKGLL